MKKTASDILVEDAVKEAFSNDPRPPTGWPKTYTITRTVDSLGMAMIAHEEGDEETMRAIDELLKLNELRSALSQVEVGADDDFGGDDGVFLDDSDAETVVSIVDAHDTGFVQSYEPGFVRTANAKVSQVIGNWLKSIDVKFRYNVDPSD